MQCAQISQVISVRIPRAERHEQFQSGLIGLRRETLNHLRPVFSEHVSAPATGFVRQTTMLEVLDNNAAGSSIIGPALYSPIQRTILSFSEVAGELQA